MYHLSLISKRLLIPLIAVIVLCVACSPADRDADLTPSGAQTGAAGAEQPPSEAQDADALSEQPNLDAQAGASVQQPSEAAQDPANPAAAPANETPAPSGTPQPSDPPGQQNQPPDASRQDGELTTDQNNAPPASNGGASPAPPSGNAGSSPAPPSGNAGASPAPPSGNVGASPAPPSGTGGASPALPSGTGDVASAPPGDGPVILTISGNGMDAATTWTLAQLQALRDGYRETTFSTTNNWPSFSAMAVQGISLPFLLRQAGLKNSAASVKFVSTDGYSTTLTYNQVFGKLYSYANHSATGSSGASAVEPVVAWAWGDVGKVRSEKIRPFFGQSGPWEVNTAAFVKDLCKIEVSTAATGAWPVPGVSIAGGSTVPAGTELEFSHGNMDNVRIYYTLNGAEPDYSSPVYNQSASYMQPHLIKPLVLTESVTLKAFAAGLGKEKSAVVTISITVE